MSQSENAYTERRKAIDDKIAELQAGLTKMDEEQAQNPLDWGFVGNAGQIIELLNELCEFVETGDEND